MRKKEGKNYNAIITILVIVIILILAIAAFIIVKNNLFIFSNNDSTTETETTAVETEKIEQADLTITDTSATVSDFYTYGTHFNLQGNITSSSPDSISSLEFVLVDTSSGKEKYSDNMSYSCEDGSSDVTFEISDKINTGLVMESFDDGNYMCFLRTDYLDGKYEYTVLENGTEEEPIEYYTVTEDDANQKINIDFGNTSYSGSDISTMTFAVSESELPDDVYDIVIDAGHGGKDSGAVSSSGVTEAELTILYAKDLYTELTKDGYKVKLTRDGTESEDTMMAYTMYDTDGRVNVACASNAKLCLSIHFNSTDSSQTLNGVQVYCSYKGDYTLAKSFADNIVKYAYTEYSNMGSYKVADGTYQRAFLASEIEESKQSADEDGYDYYNWSTDLDYYYMIRELGGIATDAYVDGRSSDYGVNLYRNDNSSIESLIIESGYISDDTDFQNITNNRSNYVSGIASTVKSYFDNL